jgi:hypothetical protein
MGTNFLIALGMERAAAVKLLAAATHEMYASAPEVLRQPMGSISYFNLIYAQARLKLHSARIKLRLVLKYTLHASRLKPDRGLRMQ